jgi:hypothetical protein
MIDLFTLRGAGPARLSNGFLANYRTNFEDVQVLRPIDAFGDPLDFNTGQPYRDPL